VAIPPRTGIPGPVRRADNICLIKEADGRFNKRQRARIYFALHGER
jgi:hypothetical protein